MANEIEVNAAIKVLNDTKGELDNIVRAYTDSSKKIELATTNGIRKPVENSTSATKELASKTAEKVAGTGTDAVAGAFDFAAKSVRKFGEGIIAGFAVEKVVRYIGEAVSTFGSLQEELLRVKDRTGATRSEER